ncbi:MAG TPA: energy transducer TonB [Pyrinomonadaceae bacterium]|nr:energy transducer TonB [Pyrinomonadaceae bacterium]
MFSNLVESGSHAADLKRRGSFFAGALAFYGLLLAAAGVASVYAFNAHLDTQTDYEVLAVLRFRPQEEPSGPARADAPRPASAASREPRPATAREIAIDTPYRDRVASDSARVFSARTPVVIAPFDSEAVPGGPPLGPPGPGGNPHTDGGGPRVVVTSPPPPAVKPPPTPAPTPRRDGPLALPSSVITSKAVHKPVPPYPLPAKIARIHGTVAVHILVDEQGRVVSAKATSGNPLLQHAAVQAARQARFTPTLLNGQPVRVTGVITYNFTLQ